MKNIPDPLLNHLRKKAEELLKNNPARNMAEISEADSLRLIHELEVHQVELEMQYEELLLAKKQAADAASHKYAQLYNFAPTAYFTLNQLGEITGLNHCGAALLGMERSLLLKFRFDHFVTDDTKPDFNLFLEKVFKSSAKETCEVNLTGPDKIPVYVALYAIATEYKECFVTAVDITDRRKAEESLKEGERFIKETQEIAQLGSYTIDFKKSNWFGSDMLYKVLGVKPDFDKTFEGWMSVIHPDWKLVMRNYFEQEVLLNKKKFDKEYQIIRHYDQCERWIHGIGRLEFDDHNQPLKLIGTLKDITESKLAEEKIQVAHSRIQKFFNSDIVGVLVADASGKVLETNDYYLTLIGYSRSDFESGKVNWRSITPPEWLPADDNSIRELRETGKCTPYEKEYIRKDGSRIFVLIADTLLTGPNEQIAGFILDISERKKADEAIRESEEQYRFMFANNPQPMWIFDTETLAFLEVNEAAVNHYGYSREEFQSMTLKDIRPAEDMSIFQKNVGPTELDLAQIHEVRHLKKNGEIILVQISWHSMLYKSRKARHILINDITERKKAEDALRESELKYRELIENSPDAIVIYSKGEIILVNKGAVQLLAAGSSEELLGKKVLQFVHPDYRKMVTEQMKKMVADGIFLPLSEEVFVRTNGSKVVVEVKAMPIRFENQQAVQLIIRDITERKQAEEAVQNSELKFRQFFEANTDGILVFNVSMEGPPSSIIDLNESAAKMVGYTKEEMRHLTPDKFEQNIPFEEIAKRRHDLITKGFSSFETTIIHKDGHEIEVEIKVMLMKYNNQTALMNIVRDITDRKNSEIQLQKYAIELRKQIAEKDKFFSIIAHDLRGPFNGFLELTELMASGSSGMSMEDIQKIASVMKKSATNLFRLLGNLLEWSRMQRGITTYDPRSIILNSKIHEITGLGEEAASKKGITVNYSIPKDLVVFADENMLEGILRNLVANAVKYSNAGGSVTVSARYVPGDTVEFSIKDNGIGMSTTVIDNLFNLDVNTNRNGTAGELSTGLGLMICKDFIEKHQGVLRIESEVGKGSTFVFTIPGCIESTPEKTNSYPASDNTPDRASKLNILIAEDEETSDLLISIALAKISRESYHAKTGLEAIDICRVHPIDLIMMDIKMPEMDGYEATRRIRLFNKDVIIIAQTAYTFSNDREKALEAGCNDYISKPISQTELMETIRKYFK
jgi:PAS domain S-box-containing protein